MNEIVGIDLGTTNSLIGVMDSGFPLLLAGAEGGRLTPSVVHVAENGEIIAGAVAARMRVLHPAETVSSIKRFMGRRGEEIETEEAEVPYRLLREKGRPLRVAVRDKSYAPEDFSAAILSKLKADAEQSLGHAVSRAVITVPAYFNDAQRSATKKAGELAGFAVERIINEPTAAALAYGVERRQNKSHIAVYDLGGGTFDISILELRDGLFEVLSTNGNTRLGGDDIDRALLALERFQAAGLDPSGRARLLEAVIAAKHRLSEEEEIPLEIPFVAGARSLAGTLSRAELESVARPIVERTRAHCRRALADAKLSPRDLDDVILVGGATRMPLVRQLVREVFEREPNISQNPDEAVALGAAIQAGILSGAVRNVVLLDVTPLSLGIETFGGLMNVIIPRNSTIPTRAGEMFTTAVSNQRAMSIAILQGERELARDNWKLGQFEIEFEPAPKGVPRVGVQFEIDVNGILHVLARDTQTGREKVIEVSSAVDVSDEAVEAMLADSLEHAFEDVHERIWTENRLKADEMLAAVDSALGLIGDEIAAEEKSRIIVLATEVRAALASHETNKLKEATAALDSATQHLAAVILERALNNPIPAPK